MQASIVMMACEEFGDSPDDIHGTGSDLGIFTHERNAGSKGAVDGEQNYASIWRENKERQISECVISSVNNYQKSLCKNHRLHSMADNRVAGTRTAGGTLAGHRCKHYDIPDYNVRLLQLMATD